MSSIRHFCPSQTGGFLDEGWVCHMGEPCPSALGADSLCVSFVCALSSLSICACCDHMVFYPELPAHCFISQPSGTLPEGFGIVSLCSSGIDVSWQRLKPLLALSTQNPNLPTLPVNSHTWSMFMTFFSL